MEQLRKGQMTLESGWIEWRSVALVAFADLAFTCNCILIVNHAGFNTLAIGFLDRSAEVRVQV